MSGWHLIPDAIPEGERVAILSTLVNPSWHPATPLGLSDCTDVSNTVYTSKRSPGVRYTYLADPISQEVNRAVANRLREITGHQWLTGLNKVCLPVFMYEEGAFIKAHRGRDIGYGNNDIVAVAMLTEPGVDFNGGEFYLNPKAQASKDGKTVWDDRPEDRILFPLAAGSILIFDNPNYVHATLPTKPGSRRCFRATASWRIQVAHAP